MSPTKRHDAHTVACISRLLGATAIALIISQPDSAQAQAQDRQTVEEIIVTARKREENIQTTPISITAVSAAQLESRNAVDLTDVQKLAPNLALKNGGGSSGASFTPLISIRGIGQNDFTINTDPGVGIYIDGVYLGRSLGSVLDLADVERVEVLRGPQGTLFGRNSIGGAVSVVSKAPSTDGVSGSISGSVGSREFANVRGSVNLPLGDKLALRVSAMGRHRDGYIDALQYDDFKLGGEKVWGVRAALRFEPTESLTFDFAVDHTERRDRPAPAVPLRLGDLSDDQSGPTGAASRFFNSGVGPAPIAVVPWISTTAPRCATDADFRRTSRTCYGDAWLAGNTGTHAVWRNRAGEVIRPTNTLDVTGYVGIVTFDSGLGTLKSITAYREFGSVFFGDPDHTPYTVLSNHHETEVDGRDPFNQRQFSQELQLVGDAFDGRLNYVFGYYYFTEKGDEAVDLYSPALISAATAVAAAPFLPLLNTASRSIDNSSKAGYAQLTFALTERLKLTGGIRYTDETKDFTVRQIPPFGAIRQGRGVQGTKLWTPMFNVAWQATDDIMAYGTYSEGYRAGGFGTRFAGGLPNPLPSFEPEFVTSYEAGIKSTLFDRRLTLNASAFLMDYTDMQVQATTPIVTGFVLNLAEARLTGFEAEARAVLGGGFTTNVSVGYIHKKLTSVLPGTVAEGGTNVAVALTTKNKLPGPAWQVNAQLAHRLDFANGGWLDSSIDVHYESKDVNNVENYAITLQKAYAEVDARLAYTLPDEKLTLALGARNLFDKTYFTQKRLSSSPGSVFGTIARPREVYAQATYRFGS